MPDPKTRHMSLYGKAENLSIDLYLGAYVIIETLQRFHKSIIHSISNETGKMKSVNLSCNIPNLNSTISTCCNANFGIFFTPRYVK